MTDTYQLSLERPHISLSPSDEIDCLQEPITTFTALLHAAQSAEIDTPAVTNKKDADLVPDSSVIKRRLRNRVSCRKTRLKRKLQLRAVEVLARERQERHGYLTQLACELGVDDGNERLLVSDSNHHHGVDELFREFAARSLHYALVDPEYSGLDDGNEQVTPAATMFDSEEAANLSTRRFKRPRRDRDNDVSSALRSDLRAPQTSLFEQWRPIVDGLQNVDLQLQRMDDNELGAGVFDRHCYWKFVGVSSVNMQRNGEIAAVAVSGITHLRFHGRHVQEVSISTVRREDNGPFDFNVSRSNTDEACGTDTSKCRSMVR